MPFLLTFTCLKIQLLNFDIKLFFLQSFKICLGIGVMCFTFHFSKPQEQKIKSRAVAQCPRPPTCSFSLPSPLSPLIPPIPIPLFHIPHFFFSLVVCFFSPDTTHKKPSPTSPTFPPSPHSFSLNRSCTISHHLGLPNQQKLAWTPKRLWGRGPGAESLGGGGQSEDGWVDNGRPTRTVRRA